MASTTDHSSQNLSGQTFRGADLDGADFTGADLRSADFTDASLVKADFTNAKFGISPLAAGVLLALAMIVSALAGLSSAYFMQTMRERVASLDWQSLTDWQDKLANSLIVIVIVTFLVILIMKGAGVALPSLVGLIAVAFVVDLTIVIAVGQVHIERAPFLIGLMLLFGFALIAGILGRIVGGAFGAWAIALMSIVGGLVAGSVEGGFTAVLVGALLVVISKRTLKGDGRDRLLRDLSHRIVTRHGTRFTGADISDATFIGTNLVAADMTGTIDHGTVWGPGQIPHRLDSPPRSFGPKVTQAQDKHQGSDPVAKFLFRAANFGDYGRVSDLVSKDFVAYLNGRKLSGDGTAAAGHGPRLLTEIIGFHGHVEDSFWQLYDEVDGPTDRDSSAGDRQIAIRFVVSGVFDGARKEIEMAGFLKVTDNKLSELRFVTDLTTVNELRKVAGLDPLT
ncbi:MAG: pentapeptide repeat-containing protein [Actinomycetia bacterium]|nr:pentapeptide repeat-containing protein [Actinomycetes bacterium]